MFLSPILAAPEYRQPALGWETLERVASQAVMPVFACGGLTAAMLGRALDAGAAGIAVGDIFNPPDTARPANPASARLH